MGTGEGKTLMATLPAYLNALSGKGVHIVTVNDYLAQRDAEWMGRLYGWLGLTTGINLSQMSHDTKQSAYGSDITYGTNNEFGFDYLRDNMVYDSRERVQRGLNFAIVDEVDSILIDEARTPLIISGQAENHTDLYHKLNAVPPLLTLQVGEETPDGKGKIEVPGDYTKDEKAHQVLLTEAGHEKAEEILTRMGLLPEGASLYDSAHISLIHHLYAALLQCRVQVMDQADMRGIVKRGAFRQQAHAGENLFRLFMTSFGQQHLVRLLVLGVVAGHFDFALAIGRFLADLQSQQRRYRIQFMVQVGMVLGLAGNDQRSTRFIDQDRVHFIDNGEVQAALHALAAIVDHVIAQVVKAEFIIGAIGDVGTIGGLLGVMRHLRQVDASGQAEPAIQAPHPFGIALGQVIIDRNDMHPLARQGIEIGWQGRHQRLALTGAHFGDFPEMQGHAADQLHIEVTHLQYAPAGLATYREGFRQKLVERFALGEAFLEFRCLGLQLRIRQFFHCRFERIDGANGLLVLLDQPLVAAAENLGQE